VLTSSPCTATCVIDGTAIKLTFFPNTGVLLITDSTGSRAREAKWYSSWRSLLAMFRDLSETPIAERTDPDMLFDRPRYCHPDCLGLSLRRSPVTIVAGPS
jgi:hypothetical protein